MPQAVWVGDLSFGLVNIPIKLYAATSRKRVRFHHYEAGTGRRIHYRRVAAGATSEEFQPVGEESESETTPSAARPRPSDEQEPTGLVEPTGPKDSVGETEAEEPVEETEVPWEAIVKGYEVEPGRVVTVDAEELESVAPERSRALEVEQFIDLEDIDPVHFEKSYYVIPQREGVTERPYWLLYRAMEEAGKVAIGRFVMRTKEYLVAVRPAEHVLMLETLFYADEVRDPKEFWISSMEEPSDRELRIARQLLEALEGEWEPDRRPDEHRQRLLELLHSKLDEAVVVPETEAEPPVAPVSDLLETLMASVEAAKRAREEEDRRTG
jgi:DNA end-binding protein Ku